jgi:phosphoribosylformylglycinamidine synthase
MAAFAIVVTSFDDAHTSAVYLVGGTLQSDAVVRLTNELLCDPVIQHATWHDLAHTTLDSVVVPSFEIAFRAGVTDNEAESILVGAQRLGITGITQVRTLRRYAAHDGQRPAYNDLIQTCHAVTATNTAERKAWYLAHLAAPTQRPAAIAVVPIRELDDDDLISLSQKGLLALDLAEMRTIQAYYRTIGREPSDGEIETIAQTWSEHCSHKTFKGRVHYSGTAHDLTPTQQSHHPGLVALGTNADIDSLIRTYLMKATNETAPRLTHLRLISAFVDNAGIVAFDDELELSFKVETHNHPSALEPFGGANTGLGGVLRDVLGVSAQPIAATDVFCFGPRDADLSTLGGHVLPPHQVAHGVVAGVQDYGNKIGVPIVNGAVFYDPGYVANPLVFAGTVGLAPQGKHPRNVGIGDAIVVLGGRTGRDGIHGATFSSIELTHTTAQEAGSAVQIGDPITEKKLIDVVIQARDAGLYSAITDCGAGGLSSAIGEMGEKTGARVELAQVPRKYAGLQPWEVWLSEAQERIVMAVPQQHLAALLALCDAEEVEATAVGTYDGSGRLVVTHHGDTLVDIDMHMLHDGRPQRTLAATWQAGTTPAPAWQERTHNQIVTALLAHPNIASRAPIIRGYDHEVQGRTVVKPLVGAQSDGPGDAAVLHVRPDRSTGVAIGCGMAPQLSQFDPYWMGLAAVDEALRNVVAVGADPSACTVLDNFCWGDPRQPDRMGGLTRATVACYDAALAYGTPFISGKDSLNNEYRTASGQRIPIPGTLLISAMAYHPDIRRAQTSDFKQAGNAIYVVGMTQNALAGAHVAQVAGIPDAAQWQQPRVDLAVAPHLMRQLHRAIQHGSVVACHDISDGGLAVAVAEMVIAGRLGATIALEAVPSTSRDPFVVLYSESPSRFVVEVPVTQQRDFEATLQGIPWACVGHVSPSPSFTATNHGQTCVHLSVDTLVAHFQTAIL